MKSESSLNWPTLNELRDSQPLWYCAAWFNFAVLAFCLVAGIFDERTLNGVSVWSKPIKFGLSIGLYFITLVWFTTFLSRETLTGTAGKILVAIPLVAGVTEMVYIAIMAGLGHASHFNLSSSFTSIMYSLMGVGAAAMVLVLPWIGYLVARQNPIGNPLILAIVAGLCVTCVLGGGFGSYLGGQDGHWVNASRTDASGVWLFNGATDGGDLRVAHFFGMHAMHAFPLFAILLPKNWGQSTKLLLLIGFIAVYTVFSIATFIEALNGQAFLPG